MGQDWCAGLDWEQGGCFLKEACLAGQSVFIVQLVTEKLCLATCDALPFGLTWPGDTCSVSQTVTMAISSSLEIIVCHL